MNEESKQAQWESHSRDEEDAIREQQATAGDSHEPVVDSVTQRIPEGGDSPTELERQRCADVARRWLEPSALMRLAGPFDVATVIALQRVVCAIVEDILREPPAVSSVANDMRVK